jgi:hypothetical protein
MIVMIEGGRGLSQSKVRETKNAGSREPFKLNTPS